MGSEVFRFVTVHPPQEVPSLQAATATTIDLGISTTPFTDSLRTLRSAGSRAGMIEAATTFVGSGSFIGSSSKIDAPYLEFMAALRLLPEQNFSIAAGQAFTHAFNTTPSALVMTDAFVTFYGRTSDSIVAATIDASVPSKVRALLVEVVRALGLIRRLVGAANVTRSAYASAPLVVPPGIFPLPAATLGLKEQRMAGAAADRARAEARGHQVAQLTAELTAHREAVDELLDAFERIGAQPTTNGNRSVTTAAGEQPAAGFALADAATEQLTGATKDVLRSVGIGVGLAAGPIDVAKTVTLLERQSVEIARKLYADRGAVTQMVRVGNVIIPRADLAGELVPAYGAAPAPARTPGPCPPAPATTIPADEVTVPTGHGDAKVLGIADLMIVEQDLLRYELGEVAHIENVLKSETRSRTFKTSSTTEVTQTTETETTEEKSQDLSSAERFELQTESQTVINDTASKSAGLTIHASYGPTVDATSNFNYSSSNSRQQSTGASASFAREVTTKAAHRVQTRTLARRTVRTVNVIEETNEHGFDNKSGSNDIVGVYRFVDKVYLAQVVNYGKRLMLEFIVPEPAAFVRHAMTHSPLDGVSVVEPEPPGYCLGNGAGFAPLQAEDITRENYLFWASKYGAQDVTTPPPSLILASGARKSPDSMPTSGGDRFISSEVFDVAIADGYLCQSAFVNLYGETQAGAHKIVYQLQDQQRQYVEPVDDSGPFLLRLQPTPALSVTVNSLGFYNYEVLVTVLCTLGPEKFQAWQLKTFNSIMNAYYDQKSRFDQAVAEAKLQARDTTLGGTNPVRNRETEQIELKKGCVSLLTGQRFDLFDAVSRNVAPFGYPEIDFAEATAEGPYIQAFEQSFEWNNVTYVFYPYFWGSKGEWPILAQLTDDDPLFARFLAAGAARVQVPVRLGFEARMLTYLATGELWSGDGMLVNSDGDTPDQLHLSILDELRSQLGDNTVRGVGTITVSNGSANVTGNGTAFTADDENRRIRFGGKTYVIKTVVDAQNIKLSTIYTGDNASGIGYSLGGKLVGEPWEVKLPTDLVKLDNSLVFS